MRGAAREGGPYRDLVQCGGRNVTGAKGPLAMLGGVAALDATCAPCRTSAFSDGLET